MRFKDAVEEVAELGVHASELDEAENGAYHEDAHEEGLIRYWPDNFPNRYRQRCLLLNVPSEGPIVAHSTIQNVPANSP